MTAAAPPLIDRREFARTYCKAEKGRVVCGDCWEPIVWAPPPNGATLVHLAQGLRSNGWRHVRTDQIECAPVCDGCGNEPGTIAIIKREFNGSITAPVTVAFVCVTCRAAQRAFGIAIVEAM